MINRGIFYLGLILTVPHLLSAQSLRVGYFGETVTHYGLRAAYDQPIASKVSKRNSAHKILYWSAGLAAYRHPQNHVGLIVSPELGYRRIGKRGSLFEFALSPAYFRYFLEGRTFEATPEGDFRRVRMAGGNAFLPTVSVSLGHDLSVRRQVPLAWYVRLNVMQQRPYNTSHLTRFGIEAGTLLALKKR
ncbi:hypothetical protein [Dyadobacter crusticola]|uniref:hypothetical protein n=1 Tax=Dyadobacter crusticola TaxID=292407 RepID=UPI0004E10349|nr:hypothetical protein [Dyadobacter crusticola]